MNNVWVLIGMTDSGDDVGPYVWKTEPTTAQVKTLLKKDWPDDVEAGTIDDIKVIKVALFE